MSIVSWPGRCDCREKAALTAQADSEGSKQEITRDAVRNYLMRHRRWDTSLLSDDETFDLGGPIGKDDIRDAMNRPA